MKHDEIPTIEDEAAPAEAVPVIDDADADELPAHAVLHDDGSVTLPFKRPVVLRFKRAGAAEISEERHAGLHLHRLTGADMAAISATAAEKRPAMSFARSARMPPARMQLLYNAMDGADVVAAAAVIGFFLGNGATTGR